MTGFGNNTDWLTQGSNSLFSGMAQWGQPVAAAAASGVTEDMLRQAQYNNLIQLPGFEAQRLEIARNATTPPSKWQTGTQTFGNIANGLANLGQIWMGLKGMKLQKEAFNFNKGVANTNLNNSITDYNRRLEDTLANRALNNGQGQGWISDQLAKYSAKRS